MPNAGEPRVKYKPQYTNTARSKSRSLDIAKSSHVPNESVIQRSEVVNKEIKANIDDLPQISTTTVSTTRLKTSGFLKRKALILAIFVVCCLAIAAVAPALAYSLTRSNIEDTTIITTSTLFSNTTPTTVTTQTTTTATTASTTTATTSSTTTTTTTSTTTSNPCALPSYRWNTTGITIINSSQISNVSGLYFDSNDTLYIVDEYPNSVVWKLPKNAVTPILVAGIALSRGTGASQLNRPQGVYVDSNKNMYVTDCYGHRVQKYVNGSTVGITIAGITGSSGTALNQLNCPRYFWLDPSETYLYINDNSNQRTMRYLSNSTTGTNGTLVAGGNSNGNSNIQLHYPVGIHYLPSVSSSMYIANNAGHSIMQWIPGASSGTFTAGIAGVSGSNATLLNSPVDLKIDTYLNIYAVDGGNHRVQMFCQTSQNAITIAGTGTSGNGTMDLNSPRSIAFDSSMNMYIGDTGNIRIQKFMKL